MKKTIAILLGLALLLTGCAGQRQDLTTATTEGPTQAPTTWPTEATVPETTAPKTTETRVMGEGIPAAWGLLDGGTAVEVMGYDGTYAKVRADGKEGLAETRLLRFADDPFEGFTGYALWNAGLYGDFSCLGEPLETLATNAKVEVLEDLEDYYYVNYNGKTGFLPASQLSRYPYTPPAEGGSSDSSGGASGGGGPQDGGDISLRAVGTLRLLAEGEKTGAANVKVDGVPLILRFCTLGETVRVLDGETAPAGYTAVLESEGKAYVPTDWLENTQTFTPWEGYAGSNCGLYASFQLTGTPEKTIYANSKLTVLWTAGEVSLVQVDSARYYARTATLTKTPIQMTPTPEAPASEGTDEELWTPPVM